MKKQNVIYHADGENAGTYGPLCFAENFSGDLSETCERFVNWDFDMLTTVSRYKVVIVRMPEWMDEYTFIRHHVALKYAVGLGGDMVYDMGEREFMRFISLNEKQKYWYGWAYGSKNGFVLSLREQFDKWLSDPNTSHGSPLSPRQWEAGTRYCPLWKAKQISSSLYNNRYV